MKQPENQTVLENPDYNTDEPLFTWRMVVLTIILASTTLLTPNYFSPIIVASALIVLLSYYKKIKVSYIYLVLPLIAIFILGIKGISGHNSFHIFRDITYALTPISLLYLGYWIADKKRMWPLILKTFIFFGIGLSIMHLSNFIINPSLILRPFNEIRLNAFSPEANLVILSFLLGLFQKRIGPHNLFPKFMPRYIAMPILLLSFLLSFSRIGLVVGIVLTISISGFIGRINLKTLITAIIIFIGVFLLIQTTSSSDDGTFMSKIARSGSELTVTEYEDLSDINSNWRGFETYMALLSFESGSLLQKIAGQGFGSVVDLGFSMVLAGNVFTEIPILHNGYAYVLLKTGILGLLCYLFYYFSLIKFSLKSSVSANNEQIMLSRLLLGCTLSLMLSMYVVGGMAQIHDSQFVLLCGYFIRRIEQLRNEQPKVEQANAEQANAEQTNAEQANV